MYIYNMCIYLFISVPLRTNSSEVRLRHNTYLKVDIPYKRGETIICAGAFGQHDTYLCLLNISILARLN